MNAPQPLARLRAARIAAGLTCRQLGAAIGRTESHFAKIERGEVALSAAQALTICGAVNLTLPELLDRAPVEPVTA